MPIVTNEESFLNAIKQRNLEGFSSYYDSYAPVFYGFITQTLHEKEVCEQTLEKSFCTIWTSINDYDPAKERLFIWSFKIVRREVSTKKIDLVLREIFACQPLPSLELREKNSVSV